MSSIPYITAVLTSDLDATLAFSRWKFYVPEDTSYIAEFLRSALDFSVENLGVFLQWLLPGNISYPNGAIKFIEGFYPVSDIILRLEKTQEDKVQWRAEHTAAIQRFWDFYKQESSSPSPPEPDEESSGNSE